MKAGGFVGRLRIDTTEEDLRDFLTTADLSNPACKRFASEDCRTFRTAAFMVSSDASCADLFNDEATWPVGSEIGDGVFKEKPKSKE